MNVLVYLIPLALMLGGTWLLAFLWTMRNGQYDDMEGPAWRILSDEDLPK
jgi:cbb3-type cytochrome oxidase maturation protein